MYTINKIINWLHSFTTPILVVIVGITIGFFGLLLFELLITELPIFTLIIIIIYAIHIAKKKKYQ